MHDNQSLDEMRRRIQESLINTTREQLQEEFGPFYEGGNTQLPPELHIEWLDYILEFERQAKNAPEIKVRERLGNPAVTPLDEVPPEALEEALDQLLDLLAEHNIGIDFLGDWDDQAAYRYITQELFDEMIEDIRIEGMVTWFHPATPEYDVQQWVELYTVHLLKQDRDYLERVCETHPLFDMQGQPQTLQAFMAQVSSVWEHLPAAKQVSVQPLETQVSEQEARVTALICWVDGTQQHQVESFFKLTPSRFYGWDVVQTSLLDDLLKLVR